MSLFQCDKCHKHFNHKKNLNRHKLNHGKVKYTCPKCLQSFHRSDLLSRHEKSCESEYIASVDDGELNDIIVKNVSSDNITHSTSEKESFDDDDDDDASSVNSISFSDDSLCDKKKLCVKNEDYIYMLKAKIREPEEHWDHELEVIVGDNGNPTSIRPTFEDAALNSVILRHASLISASHQNYTTCLIYNFPLPLERRSPHLEINELFVKLFECRGTNGPFRMNFSLGSVCANLLSQRYFYFSTGYGPEYFEHDKRIDKRSDLPVLTSENCMEFIEKLRETETFVHVVAPNIRINIYPLDVASSSASYIECDNSKRRRIDKYYCKRLDRYYDDELSAIEADQPDSIKPSFEDSKLNSLILKHAHMFDVGVIDNKSHLQYTFLLPLEMRSLHPEINNLLVKIFESKKTTDSFRINFSLRIVYKHYMTQEYSLPSLCWLNNYFSENKRIDKKSDLPVLTSDDYLLYTLKQRGDKNLIPILSPCIRFDIFPLGVVRV